MNDWHREQNARVRQAQDLRDERERAALQRMAAALRAKRAHVEAAAAPKDRGRRWRVCEGPTPHWALEELVRTTYARAFHAIPFPAGWRARWGEIDSVDPRKKVLAVTVHNERTIVVDRRHFRRSDDGDFQETLVHELVHVLHPTARHGPAFERTLASALAYLAPASETSSSLPPAAAPGNNIGSRWKIPEVRKGARPGLNGVWFTAPHLNPEAEYRG